MSKGQKTRKLSICVKILLLVSMLILAICILMGVSFYRSVSDGMVLMGAEEAEMAAKIAVDVVDGNLVSELEPGCEETEEYQSLLKAMRKVQERYLSFPMMSCQGFLMVKNIPVL